MNYFSEKLKQLEDIACNPNVKGGVWNSFSLFLSISDEIIKDKDLFLRASLVGSKSNEEILGELSRIRERFEEIFGFELESGMWFGQKFQKLKNCEKTSHKFRSKISKFMQDYKGKFFGILKASQARGYNL